MHPRNGKVPRKSGNLQEGSPSWILIAGGALLSTLSIRLDYKLKQVLDGKKIDDSSQNLKDSSADGKSGDWKKSGSFSLHSIASSFTQEEDGCYNHYDGSNNVVEIKQQCNSQFTSEPEIALPLVTIPTLDFNKVNGFHQSNSSESLSVSESGSDIFSKREFIQKLRQQLKRRDDMILEMQDQIAELHNSLSSHLSHSSHLQSLLNAANRDLFDSEMEIQRLSKAIADHCVGHKNTNGYLDS